MELPSKLLDQIAFNTRSQIEEPMLIAFDSPNHEEPLSQSLKTSKKQFKKAIPFLRGYNGYFQSYKRRK